MAALFALASAPAAESAIRFGVNDLRGWWMGSPNLPVGYPVAAHRNLVTRDLNDMAAHRLTYRVTFVMSDMDTNGDGLIDSWQFSDAMFKTAAQRGVNLLVVLTSRVTPTTGAARAAFAKGARALVTRYKPGGGFWTSNPALKPRPLDTIELWNEPNQTGYWSGSAQDYGKLLGRVWDQAVLSKAGFKLVSGGVSEVSSDGRRGGQWLAAALAVADDELSRPQASPYFALQSVGLHAYGTASYTADKAVANTRQFIADLSAWSAPLGAPPPPVWITEFGWKYAPVTDPASNTYSESDLLARYTSAVNQWVAMGSAAVGGLYAYAYRMGGTTGNIDDGFGWNDTTGTLSGDDTTQAQKGTIRSFGAWFENKALTAPK